ATKMNLKSKRTIISIQKHQPVFDFDEAEHFPPFTFPEYQRALLVRRIVAALMDFGIAALVYCIFIIGTYLQMPDLLSPDRRVLGVYGAGFFILVAIYFFLFMLSASQTPGMKHQRLAVVTTEGTPLDPWQACVRGFGYLISILPLMLGFLWAL